MRDIVIIGTGGCAKEIMFLLEENNTEKREWNILGFVDEKKTINLKYPIIGDDEWLLKISTPVCAVIAIGEPSKKKCLARKFEENQLIDFPTIISRHALIGSKNVMGKGTVICSGVTITTDVEIKDFVTVNIGTTICHESFLGDYTTIAPGVNISGNVHIGEEANIGVGTKIIQNIKIGNGAIVGAGTIVIRNVDNHSVVVGNPGRKLDNKGKI